MIANVLTMVSLALVFGSAQTPDGRWDGTVTHGTLKVPFTINFELKGKALRGSFVHGDTLISSTDGSFEAGTVRLTFGATGPKLEARIVDGQLSGVVGTGQDMHPFTASQFCACGYEGEAGPDISGMWEVSDSNLGLAIRRKGEDTLATITRPNGELGPLTGRFDGVSFSLHYFDGARAAVLEIEQRKDGGLELKLAEPGAEAKKYRAAQATTRRP